MLARPLCLALLMVALAACAREPSGPELDYLPPSGPIAATPSPLVRQPPGLVWGNIVDRLQQEGVRLERLDERAGEIVVGYHGDPEPYVNCGWLVRYDEDEPLEQIRASIAKTELVGRLEGRRRALARELVLDARLRVRIRPVQDGSVVSTDGTYSLTKTLRSKEADGGWRERHREVIVFDTGESAAFEQGGTLCQPTGALERLVLDSLPATTVVGTG